MLSTTSTHFHSPTNLGASCKHKSNLTELSQCNFLAHLQGRFYPVPLRVRDRRGTVGVGVLGWLEGKGVEGVSRRGGIKLPSSALSIQRSRAGRCSWAAKVGLLSLRVVPQQRCNGHCLCDSAQARQLKQQSRSAQVAGQWRGNTALTLPLFWAVHGLSGLFRAVSGVEPSLFRPPPPPLPPRS